MAPAPTSLPPQASASALKAARMAEGRLGQANAVFSGGARAGTTIPAGVYDAQDDPDRHYFSRGLGRLDSDDEESDDGSQLIEGEGEFGDDDDLEFEDGGDDSAPTATRPASASASQSFIRPQYSYDLTPAHALEAEEGASANGAKEDSTTAPSESAVHEYTPEEEARFQWQHMLSNVLQGDVLSSEKTRISTASLKAATLAAQVDVTASKRQRAYAIWLLVRAYVRERSTDQESRYLEEARAVVDEVLDEALAFRVEDPVRSADMSDETYEDARFRHAAAQVDNLLSRIDWCESLYPSQRALQLEKPKFGRDDVFNKLQALRSWQVIEARLNLMISTLTKFAGDDDWRVLSRPWPRGGGEGSTAEAQRQEYAPLDFAQRLLRQDQLELRYSERVTRDIYDLARLAKKESAEFADVFAQANLPSFTFKVTQIAAFPPRCEQEALALRLENAARVTDPTPVLLDQLTSDMRRSLRATTDMARMYEEIARPPVQQPGDDVQSTSVSRWTMPDRIEGYQQALERGLAFFFKLLHWKLKSPAKAIYFKETEIVESEWSFMSSLVNEIEDGDVLIGEHFSTLTHRLLHRILNYFETQLQVLETRDMPLQETLRWWNQTLDNVRARHRKLLRFSKSLLSRFENSAEYDLNNIDLTTLIHALVETDHFIIYTGTFEQTGTYVIGDPSLHERPDFVRHILTRCYTRTSSSSTTTAIDALVDEMTGGAYMHYVLILTPRDPFIWDGRVMNLELPPAQFDLRDRRLRIVADGPGARLTRAKRVFLSLFPSFASQTLVEQKAHLARIGREVKKIRRTAHRLSETILGSVERVQAVSRRTPGESQEIVGNYFSFASDLGERSMRHLEPAVRARAVLSLMRFAIAWVAFICDDCVPTDPRTFKWAVVALEFALRVSEGDHILRFSVDEFGMMRAKVASCMTLLMSHFDILGARQSSEAKKQQERVYASRIETHRLLARKLAALKRAAGVDPSVTAADEAAAADAAALDSLRPIRDRRVEAIGGLEARRREIEQTDYKVGVVLDQETPEDRSLAFLAGSASNISMRWQQGRYIGGGTFGSVYLAVNLDSGEELAVKEIRFADLSSAPHLIKTIKDEMSVMERLSHPNIVQYYGIEVHRDKVYIFEEFCAGGSLANLLEHGRIEEEIVIQTYAAQLLNGLIYLHSQDIVHRDIKPDNILLDRMGTLKFVDFGAAKVLAKNQRTLAARSRAATPAAVNGNNIGGGAPAEDANSLTGTPMYLSPETVRGERKGSLGSMDIWSLGCVILECATGRRPWSNLDNEWAIMFHIGIATKHPPLPEQGQLSDLGIDFIRQCLMIDADKRPTAPELLEHPWILAFNEELGLAFEAETGEAFIDGTALRQRQVDMIDEEEEEELTPI